MPSGDSQPLMVAQAESGILESVAWDRLERNRVVLPPPLMVSIAVTGVLRKVSGENVAPPSMLAPTNIAGALARRHNARRRRK